MKKKECPSCAMEIASKENVCPICGYEFPSYSTGMKWMAALLIGLILLFLLFRIF